MLQNVHEIIRETSLLITSFEDAMMFDCSIPEEFKQQVTHIDKAKISYTNSSFVVFSSQLRIYFPNQLWYYAAACTNLYNAISQYDNLLKKTLMINGTVLKACKDDRELSETTIPPDITGTDREFLVNYLSDYNWWSGGKTIDRADYYVSPIVSTCKLVNASQSFVAEMAKFLSENPETINLLLDNIPKPKLQKKELLFSSKNITEFMGKCIREFLQYDTNMSNVAKEWDAKKKTIGFTNCRFGKEKKAQDAVTDPRRLDDCDKSISWIAGEKEYYYYKEQSIKALEVFTEKMNKVYRTKYLIEILGESCCLYRLTGDGGTSSQHKNATISPTDKNVAYSLQDYEYMAAIKAKPFLILGGFSGTGKSLAVKRLAFSACPADGSLNLSETSPGNYLLISVKPNWHDATDLTGFRSSVNRNYYVTDFMRFLVKAMHHPDVPFFVCLDEMNLAPVEEYFSDFLSVIESRKRKANGKVVTDALVPASVFNDTTYAADFNIFMSLGLETSVTSDEYEAMDEEHRAEAFVRQDIVDELKREGLTIPQNVIVVGTVNMDDTTNTFSRKVIDRAMTFETIVGTFDASYFTDSIILNYVEEPRKWELFKSDEVNAQQMVSDGRFNLVDADKDAIVGFINNINEDLEGTPFKISYRILNESVLLYRAKKKIAEIMNADGGFEKDVDFDVELNSVFDDILMQKVLPRIEGDSEKCRKCLAALKSRADENGWQKSAEKIQFMIDRFGSDGSGFTSFWN